MHTDPAVAAAAVMLAHIDGIPINQTILTQAEKAIEAATCGVSGCRLLKHFDGLHDWEAVQAIKVLIEAQEQLGSALGALLAVHGHPSDAFVQVVSNILTEYGRSADARSGSH